LTEAAQFGESSFKVFSRSINGHPVEISKHRTQGLPLGKESFLQCLLNEKQALPGRVALVSTTVFMSHIFESSLWYRLQQLPAPAPKTFPP
jgi:hypothetical protein